MFLEDYDDLYRECKSLQKEIDTVSADNCSLATVISHMQKMAELQTEIANLLKAQVGCDYDD